METRNQIKVYELKLEFEGWVWIILVDFDVECFFFLFVVTSVKEINPASEKEKLWSSYSKKKSKEKAEKCFSEKLKREQKQNHRLKRVIEEIIYYICSLHRFRITYSSLQSLYYYIYRLIRT